MCLVRNRSVFGYSLLSCVQPEVSGGDETTTLDVDASNDGTGFLAIWAMTKTSEGEAVNWPGSQLGIKGAYVHYER